VHVSVDDEATALLQRQWAEQEIEVPLRIVASPYRDISMPLIKYIKAHRAEHGSEVVTIYTPIYIVGHWWEAALHNHKSRRIRQKLMLVHGVTISLVPWLLDSSEVLYGRRSRPIPGQDRRGEPIRPLPRRPLEPAGSAGSAGSARSARPAGSPGSPGSPGSVPAGGAGPAGRAGAAVAGGAVHRGLVVDAEREAADLDRAAHASSGAHEPGPKQTPRAPGKGQNVGNARRGDAARKARSAARNGTGPRRKK
jgi:hypothetical protein